MIAAVLGLGLATALVLWLGAGKILDTIARIGGLGLLYVLLWQLAVFIGLGLAWWILCRGVSPWDFVLARLVREGGQTCLPFSEVGGLVFGARVLVLRGVGLATAASTSIVDVVTEGFALAPFLLFGILVLLVSRPHASVILPMSAGLGLLVVGGVIAFLIRHRLARLLRSAIVRLLRKWVRDAPQKADSLQQSLQSLFSQHRRIASASLAHLTCWFGGGGNVWIAYHLLGAKPSILDALAIESILSAVLGIGFLVPAGLGVQELTYVGVGSLFGIPPPLSLSLSLVRRARDIILGAPALLIWQGLEARQLRLKPAGR